MTELVVATSADRAGRLVFIDFLRGVAALIVAYCHLRMFVEAQWPALVGVIQIEQVLPRFGLGTFAVAIFFFISGFLIPATLERPGATLGDYAVRRFFRLYPLYWLSIIAAVLLSLYHARPVSWPQVAWNFTMVQAFAGYGDLLMVYWTLAIEIVFYALVAGCFITGLLHRRRLLIVLMLIAAIACAAARYHTGRGLPVALFVALMLMFLGNLIRHEGTLGSGMRRCWGFVLLVAAAVVPICVLAYGGQRWAYITAYWAAGAVFVAAFSNARGFAGGGAATRLSVFLGQISYGTYLFHLIVGIPVVDWLCRHTGNGVLSVAGGLLTTVVVSWALFHLLEQPCINAGHRIGKRLRRPHAVTTETIPSQVTP